MTTATWSHVLANPAPSSGVGDCGVAFAGVSPELLPPKKRLTRHQPYAAAARIQEMANHGDFENPPILALAAAATASVVADDDDTNSHGRCDGLYAQLLQLHIARPTLVLKKLLTATDCSRSHARLILPDRMVKASPLLRMLTPAERRVVCDVERGLPVPAFDHLGRAYSMALKYDGRARTYRLVGCWGLFLRRHVVRVGDAVEVRAFRPSAWQARLESRGEGGVGLALLHCSKAIGRKEKNWTAGEREAADGLLRLANASGDGRAAGGGIFGS